MKDICLVFLIATLFTCYQVTAQTNFRFDNKAYRTLYPFELCDFMAKNPEATLIDVRSVGEYNDTSRWGSLNIGRLKGAINIDIDSFARHVHDLADKKDKPIVLYCSHSQRSRVAGKMLVDSGFTNVYNLNAGVSWMVQANEQDFPCKAMMLVHSVGYRPLSAIEYMNLAKNRRDLIILDVRPPAVFAGKDTSESENIGRLKGAINYPAAELKNNLSSVEKYRNKTIVVYDQYGASGHDIAELLVKNRFSEVYHLTGGLHAIMEQDKQSDDFSKISMEGMPGYQLVNATEAYNILQTEPQLIILDIRPDQEYNSKSENPWRNIGHLKDAIHITPEQFDKKLAELSSFKTRPILLYGTHKAADYARTLSMTGFKNVHLLPMGLWSMVSASFNIRALQGITGFLEGHEALY